MKECWNGENDTPKNTTEFREMKKQKIQKNRKRKEKERKHMHKTDGQD